MKKFAMISAACLAAVGLAGAAQAEGPKVYAYSGVPNLCPNNTQPITINGIICCGTPNQTMTYQQVKGGWAPRASTQSRGKRMVCPEGEKGCYYQ